MRASNHNTTKMFYDILSKKIHRIAKTEFHTTRLIKDKWNELLREEQKKCNIRFDNENDDRKADPKTIEIETDSSNKNFKQRYLVELRSACGDWEHPVLYFRIQCTDGFPKESMYIFIPNIEQGNLSLTKGKKGLTACDNYKCKDSEDNDEKKAWESVKNKLNELYKNSLR